MYLINYQLFCPHIDTQHHFISTTAKHWFTTKHWFTFEWSHDGYWCKKKNNKKKKTSVFGRRWRVAVWPLFDLYLTLTTSLSALTDLDVSFSCHFFLSISNLSVSIFSILSIKKSQNVVLQQVQRSAVAQWPHTGSCRHQHQAPHPWNLHDFLLFMIIILHTCQTNLGIVLVIVLVTPGWTNSPRWLQPGGAAGQVLWSSAAAELLGPPGSRLPGGKSWRQAGRGEHVRSICFFSNFISNVHIWRTAIFTNCYKTIA